MSSMPWEEYLVKMVTTFRKEFEKLGSREQRIIKQSEFYRLPLKPCQIEVLDFGKLVIWLLIHDDIFPDMMFKVHRDVKSLDESEFINKYNYKFFIHPDQTSGENLLHEHLIICTSLSIAGFDRKMPPEYMAEWFLLIAKGALKTEQFNVIEHTTDRLKKSIAKIPDEDIKNELLVYMEKVDGALIETKRLDDEINKVRQLLGVTKEIQDWKLLISDVGKLKEEHVPREVFNTKVNELNTRINSLSEIKAAYDKILAQQTEFMKQQAEVMKQQSSFVKWIKYATILLPIAVISVPIIELISIIIRRSLNIP